MSHGDYPILKILRFLPDDFSDKKILDAGCGEGLGGFYIRQRVNRPWSKWFANKRYYLIGIDKVEDNIRRLQSTSIYDALFCEDLTTLDFERLGKIDIVLCLETAEHIDKFNAFRLLKKLTKIADFVLVSMPYREKIEPFLTPLGGQEEYRHKSTWDETDLHLLGFKTYVYDFYNISPKLVAAYDLARRLMGRVNKKELIGVWKR